MEFKCLSEGKGFYFPPCHILDVSGFRILFDCPMDLSSLLIFSPIPTEPQVSLQLEQCEDSELIESKRRRIDKPLDAGSLIRAEPRYRIVKNLLLLNAASVDLVLVSSPMGMLGLPFLTRNKDFAAKVYATEAAARIGQFMMEDLVAMNKEFRQFYGPGDEVPQWMKWEEVELLPPELKNIALGTDETEFVGWTLLYSAADVKDCMMKIKSLKYAEEACYNGMLNVKAFSSGLDIGSCNWSITSPQGSISYVSSSVSVSAAAMNLDYKALQRSDVILYSNFTSCGYPEKFEDDNSGLADKIYSDSSDGVDVEKSFTKLNDDEYVEETEKLDFICSCSMDSIRAGGSVLIPIGGLSTILQLLDRFAVGLESENLKVPIFIVSSVAEEMMAFTNVIPEWLSRQQQDKLYSGQPLFTHVEMLKEKRLYVFPAIHSPELLKNWQEPCIVFCPHWSLRLGPVVHLLRRWCRDQNSLLILEEGVDASLALLPFKPITMKVLQCSFLSGMKPQQSLHLLKILHPRHVLFPEVLKQYIGPLKSLFQFSYYSTNEKLCIPTLGKTGLDIAIEVAAQLHYTTLKELGTSTLEGELVIERGRYRLLQGNKQICSKAETKQVLHFGRIDTNILVDTLQKMEMDATLEEVMSDSGKASLVHIAAPHKALIELTESETIISTAEEKTASLVSKAVCSVLDCL